jgi:pimeloyl-ACP methyl ester carboxylesterase
VQAATPAHAARVIVGGATGCVCVWLLAVLALWLGESWLVFRTDLSRAHTAPLEGSAFRIIELPAPGDRRLESVMLRHDDDRDRHWVLFCPPAGASTRVAGIQDQLKKLWELGYNVLAFDYRGFGDSPGTPTEHGLYADALVAYRYLVHQLFVSADRIILSGRSLGAAVAVELATQVDTAGLLLLAPIDSVPRVGARLFPWAPVRLLARYQFDARARAEQIDTPVIVVHGYPDRMMRLSDTQALLHAFRGPTLLLESGGGHHHSGFSDIPLLYRALRRFWPV